MLSRIRIFSTAILLVVGMPCCSRAQQTALPSLDSLIAPAESKPEPSYAATPALPRKPPLPEGTLERPKDGVQHPDLDNAWKNYDQKIADGVVVFSGIITTQLDAAADAGALEEAEKWQSVLDAWQSLGRFPSEPKDEAPAGGRMERRPAARPVQPPKRETLGAEIFKIKEIIGKAASDLQAAYDNLVKQLTIDKNFALARKVKDEWTAVSGSPIKVTGQPEKPASPQAAAPTLKVELRATQSEDSITTDRAKELAEGILGMTEEGWKQVPGKFFTVDANPTKTCETGIVLEQNQKHLFLPCPTDRWCASPSLPNVDFRGHRSYADRVKNGMPFVQLCYSVDKDKKMLTYVLEKSVISGVSGPLYFMPSDFFGVNIANDNVGSVRVKVVPIR